MNGRLWFPMLAAVLAGTSPAAAEWDRAWTKDLNEDQIKQVEIALRRGETKARNCFQTFKVTARGPVKVTVVFDGNRGRAWEATVQPPYADTEVRSCLYRSFVGEIILPFDGPNRTVLVTFNPPN